MEAELSSYDEVAQIIELLPMLLRERRRGLRYTLRQVSDEMGVGITTLHRIENGKMFYADTAVCILGWLARQERRESRSGEPVGLKPAVSARL